MTSARSKRTWPFIHILIAPIKSAFGVIMISKNTHCPTGTGSVELYTFGPDSPACGPSAGARIVGTPDQRQRRAADAHDLDFSGNFNRAALALPRIMRAAENRPAVGAYVRTAEISSKAAAARAHCVTK